jgi:hypothetical protein
MSELRNHPLRIQRSRRRGWRKPPGAVIVDRTSRWGNKFKVADYGRQRALELYEQWLLRQPQLLAQLPTLRGRLLACYCQLDEPCHGDLLARWANEEPPPA